MRRVVEESVSQFHSKNQCIFSDPLIRIDKGYPSIPRTLRDEIAKWIVF